MPTKKNLTAELPNDQTLIEGYALGVAVDKTGDTMTGNLEAPSVSIEGNNLSPFGFKNKFINGGFGIWQRGTSQTASGYGSDDRWSNGNLGTTKVHSQQVATDTERALFNSNFFSRTVVTSVAGTSNYCGKFQAIEDVTKLAGKTVTISFWAKADAPKNIAIEMFQNFGTGGTPSGQVNGINAQLIALTTMWAKYSITLTIPSLIGKTLGTDGTHTSYTALNFWFEAGSTHDTRTASLGQQSGTFDIAEAQLEEGSVATPFEQRPIGLEETLCYRYFYKATSRHISASSGSGGRAVATLFFPTTMRTTPTLSNVSYSAFNYWNSGGDTSATIYGASTITNSQALLTSERLTALGHTVNYYNSVNAEINAEL